MAAPILAPPIVSFGPERYVSPALSGVVTFDYSNNNGRYVVGAGDLAFETAWSGGSDAEIYAYKDPPSIRTVALAVGIREISDIVDASVFDTSSRDRSPHLGEIVVWQNTTGVLTFDGGNELQLDVDTAVHEDPGMYREALK